MLLSVVATLVRVSVGETQPLIKAGLGVSLGVLFALGGAAHFAPPLAPMYAAMIPPVVPAPAALVVAVSGVLELVSGAALGATIVAGGGAATAPRRMAAWVVVGTLVGIFPANLYMALDAKCRKLIGVSRAAALVRLPLQWTLLVWAHWYTQ